MAHFHGVAGQHFVDVVLILHRHRSVGYFAYKVDFGDIAVCDVKFFLAFEPAVVERGRNRVAGPGLCEIVARKKFDAFGRNVFYTYVFTYGTFGVGYVYLAGRGQFFDCRAGVYLEVAVDGGRYHQTALAAQQRFVVVAGCESRGE